MRRPAPRTEPFAVADELTCYYDRPSEPANVHLEVRLPGRLDTEALSAAVGMLLGAEPGLRVRRARAGGWQRGFRWEFAGRADADPLMVTAYADQADLDRQRNDFVSLAPPLDSAPPFLLLLASGPDGDCLLLNAHHARFDGLACLRLLTGLGAAYGRQVGVPVQDGVPIQVGVHVQDGGPFFGPGAEPRERRGERQPDVSPARPGLASRLTGRVARVAPGQRPGRLRPAPGYGACLLTWEGPELAEAARRAGATVNDVLITALMLTIADWNAGHRRSGRPVTPGLIRITMPVGDRAQAGSGGTWANRSRLTAVAARVGATAEPAALLAEVAKQTAVAKRSQGPQVDPVSRALTAAPVPAMAKQAALRAGLRIAGPVFCDTALLSNLGQAGALAFGDLSTAGVWFSTSAHLPRGLSVGAVGSAGRLLLTFRYRRALLSAADAAEFAGRYGKTLDQLASAKAVP